MEGYDAKFSPLLTKRLECPICLLALREPMQTPCGHRFCSPCITRALRETGTRCPVDNTSVYSHQLFKDNFAKREVLCLNVFCSANDDGCAWRGELRDLETHSQICEQVRVDCPHKCGHACQRKVIASHLVDCSNKPLLCPNCSIRFVLDKIADHEPHCSKIRVPDSILSDITEANEVLKWCGHIKLKMNMHSSSGQQMNAHQFTAYLTAKAETEESFMYTGNWCIGLSVMPLNSGASQMFQHTLKSPEVVTWQFSFSPLIKDKSNPFTKMLKRKTVDQCAAVGLHLKNNTSRQDLTVMYLHWSEQKKRVVAIVADLKSHIVRQIYTRLQSLQPNPRGRGRGPNSGSHSNSRGAHSSRNHPPPSGHDHRQHQHHTYHLGPSIHTAPHPHIHHQLHPSYPIAHAAVAANTPTTILPHLLSWQTSQSFNTYPWRVQNSVPFFTFPSTPPQYLPANSYPYTFAPRPAAPFSMQPVVTHALPVPMSNEHVPVAVTLGNPPSVNVPHNAVAVSVNVIQQPVIHEPTPSQNSPTTRDMTVIHNLGHTHRQFQAAHVAPVPFDGSVIQNQPPVESFVAMRNAGHVISIEQPSMNIGMAINPSSHTLHQHLGHRLDANHPMVNSAESARASGMWVHDSDPGTSVRHQQLSGVPSPMDSSDSSPSSASSSPGESFSSIFYQSSDSDTLDTPTLVGSPEGMFRRSSSNMRSDLSFTGSGNISSEMDSDSTEHTALQTLADAALSLTANGQESSSTTVHRVSADREPLRLPVLINISDSEPDSSVATPSSIIDLTSSPLPRSSLIFSNPNIPRDQQIADVLSPESPSAENIVPPMLVPVIHHRGVYENRNSTRASGSRRVLNFVSEQNEPSHQHQLSRYAYPELPHPQGGQQITEHPGGLMTSVPQAVLRGTVLNSAHLTQPHHHSIVAAVGPPNVLTPGVAAIPTGNVQVLGWQPTFEPSHGQAPHAPSHSVSEVAMGGHLNILVPPSAVPGPSYPSAPHAPSHSVSEVAMGGHLNILVPPSAVPGPSYPSAHQHTLIQQQPRGEFWETVMPSLDMTLQNGGNPDGRPGPQ